MLHEIYICIYICPKSTPYQGAFGVPLPEQGLGFRGADELGISLSSRQPLGRHAPGQVRIQTDPWAGSLYPSRGLDSGGLTSWGFHYRRGSHLADMLQVKSNSNRPVGGVIMSHSR